MSGSWMNIDVVIMAWLNGLKILVLTETSQVKKIHSDSVSASTRFVAFPREGHSKISRTVRFFILAEAAFNIVRMA